MREMSQYITTLMGTITPRQSPRALELVDLIQQQGRITKKELMTHHLNWGRGIAFTPYRRALMAHPNIYDAMGPVPMYHWVE